MGRDKNIDKKFVNQGRAFLKYIITADDVKPATISRVIGYSCGKGIGITTRIGKRGCFKLLVNYYNVYVKWCDNNNEVVNTEVKDYVDSLYK